MPRGSGACVWNIWTDVNLLLSRSRFWFWHALFHVISNKEISTFVHAFLVFANIISRYFKQGGSARLTVTAQRRHCQFVVIQSLISSAYLHPFYHLSEWQPAKPRTGMSFSNNFKPNFNLRTSFWCSPPVRSSQSEFPLSIEDERAASERFDPSSKDIERFPLHSFSLLVIQFLLSGLTEVFLHVRCIPHQNLQRCFWANVCVCVV